MDEEGRVVGELGLCEGVLNVDGLGEVGEDDHLHPLHRVQPEQMVPLPPLRLHQGGGDGRRRAG